jgi:hypothetical protein
LIPRPLAAGSFIAIKLTTPQGRGEKLSMFLGTKGTGLSMVQLSKRLKISQPTASQSATRGEKIAKENKLKLLKNK